jgi:hypothetical protein
MDVSNTKAVPGLAQGSGLNEVEKVADVGAIGLDPDRVKGSLVPAAEPVTAAVGLVDAVFSAITLASAV